MNIITNEEFKCYETNGEAWGKNGKSIYLDGKPLIKIPDNATNGDMLMAIFQGVKIWKHEGYVCVAFDDFYEIKKFPECWWNKPYKEGV